MQISAICAILEFADNFGQFWATLAYLMQSRVVLALQATLGNASIWADISASWHIFDNFGTSANCVFLAALGNVGPSQDWGPGQIGDQGSFGDKGQIGDQCPLRIRAPTPIISTSTSTSTCTITTSTSTRTGTSTRTSTITGTGTPALAPAPAASALYDQQQRQQQQQQQQQLQSRWPASFPSPRLAPQVSLASFWREFSKCCPRMTCLWLDDSRSGM